jgi:DNA-directed RNA polymerase I, II, and III subunit RPABC4
MSTTSTSFNAPVGGGAFSSALDGGPATQYLCGDCASKVELKKGDPIRCKECGHRVLYKERTKRFVGEQEKRGRVKRKC